MGGGGRTTTAAAPSPQPPPARGRGAEHDALLWLLIVGTTALRLAFGAALGLGVDESYMVASGRALSLGYFDHPPAAWWLSWGAAHLFGSEAPIIVRLPFIALFALSTWLMYRLGAAIADARAGFWAAVLLNLSPVFGVTTGTWVLPDGPLDCALLGAALCLLRALERGDRWLVAGDGPLRRACAVLEILGGADAWRGGDLPAVEPRAPAVAGDAEALARTGGGAAGVRAGADLERGARLGVVRLPGRARRGAAVPAARARWSRSRGEALFVLPWIWLPMMVVFVAALRRGPGAWRSWLLCCLAAPPIVVFALVSAWSSQRVLFHWAAPGYLMLFPLLGDAVARRLDRPAVRRLLLARPCSSCSPLPSSRRRCGSTGCIQRLQRSRAPIRISTRSTGPHCATNWQRAICCRLARIVGVPNWRDAGKIAYALGPEVTTLCLNRDARQFGIADPPTRFLGATC